MCRDLFHKYVNEATPFEARLLDYCGTNCTPKIFLFFKALHFDEHRFAPKGSLPRTHTQILKYMVGLYIAWAIWKMTCTCTHT